MVSPFNSDHTNDNIGHLWLLLIKTKTLVAAMIMIMVVMVTVFIQMVDWWTILQIHL